MTGADAVAKVLKAEGVTQVICFPYTPGQEAVARADIRLVLPRQERVAGNMADGISRSTNGRQIGVFMVQHNAGVENAFSGVAHAHTDGTPILFLPGHSPVEEFGIPPAFSGRDNYRHVTKHSSIALEPDRVPQHMRMAFTALRSGRPRPVMVELPRNVSAAELSADFDYTPVAPIRAGADPGGVIEAADLLLRARSPLIWAGHGVLYAEASAELQEVAELLGAPVMTTLQGKSAIPETHELSVGMSAVVETAAVTHYMDECETYLIVGSSLSVGPFSPVLGPGKTLIHVTNDPSDINKWHPTRLPLAADAKLFLAQLAEELRGRVGVRQRQLRARNSETIARLDREWRAEYADEFNDDSEPINGYHLFRELWDLLDPDSTILTHESGTSRDIQSVFYKSTVPRSYLGWGQSSQLGFSVGLTLGAKLANPDKLVVTVMGDGAVGMTGMDWETAARENIPTLTIIKHDTVFSGYMRHIPVSIEKFDGRTLHGDYAGVAAALGCHAESVTALSDLRPALERAIRATNEGQPAVVDVMTAETTRIARAPSERPVS